jgi:hypothetical protein
MRAPSQPDGSRALKALAPPFVFRITTQARVRDFALLVVIALGLLALALTVPALRALAYALSPLLAVPAVLIASEWLSRTPFFRSVLSYIGQRTMSVFLVHALVLQAGIWLVSATRPTSDLVLLAAPLITSAIAVAAGLVVELVFRRSRGLINEPWRPLPAAAAHVMPDPRHMPRS